MSTHTMIDDYEVIISKEWYDPILPDIGGQGVGIGAGSGG